MRRSARIMATESVLKANRLNNDVLSHAETSSSSSNAVESDVPAGKGNRRRHAETSGANLAKPVSPAVPGTPTKSYHIPEVEHLPTTFKGRLGYACLNTILRNKKPSSESVFCARTCR